MWRADVQLVNFNTLRLPSVAQFFANPGSLKDVREVVAAAVGKGLPITVLGAGSNVVLRARVPGCVITTRIGGIQIRRIDDAVLVTAGAGVRWHDLVRYCLGQGIAGLENLALIPGLVGAAPIQNIGAYGVELAEQFHSLTAVSCRDATVVTMEARQCGFAYRDSVFKHSLKDGYLIVSVTLRLPEAHDMRIGYPDVQRELGTMGVRPSTVSIAEAVTRIRRRKLPDVRRVPNAGSFFKNPVVAVETVERLRGLLGSIPTYNDANGIKIAAARLIDAAGWKGKALGAAGVWYRQPLVLVNRGTACATDMLRLAEMIRVDVSDRFGIGLELEPAVIGTDE
jgi:UDP-N-acetylmuramate dehydrogenase